MEQLKHECGVAMIRLLKPLEYYEEVRNMDVRTQQALSPDGETTQPWAGRCRTGLRETGSQSGEEYMFRERALGSGAITEIFGTVQGHQGLDQGTAA